MENLPLNLSFGILSYLVTCTVSAPCDLSVLKVNISLANHRFSLGLSVALYYEGVDLQSDDADDGHPGGLLLLSTAFVLSTGWLHENGRPS